MLPQLYRLAGITCQEHSSIDGNSSDSIIRSQVPIEFLGGDYLCRNEMNINGRIYIDLGARADLGLHMTAV
jgi:hypothetical protein